MNMHSVRLVFKTPDVLDQVLQSIEDPQRRERIKDEFALWLIDDETVHIDFDLVHRRATVLKCGE
jgi:hypothetical protein